MNIDNLLGKILNLFSLGPYKDEIALAKKQFYEMAGVFDDESPETELKMTQFIDWFLYSRPLIATSKTPMMMLKEDFNLLPHGYLNLDELNVLLDYHHGIFEFLKTKGQDVFLKDIFLDKKIVLTNSLVTHGFEKNELFEARLYNVSGHLIFGGSFCFHPPKATKYILKESKKLRKIKDENEKKISMENFCLKLFKMRHKMDQYKHVELNHIYSNEPKVKI